MIKRLMNLPAKNFTSWLDARQFFLNGFVWTLKIFEEKKRLVLQASAPYSLLDMLDQGSTYLFEVQLWSLFEIYPFPNLFWVNKYENM